jgi:hypothetical protein
MTLREVRIAEEGDIQTQNSRRSTSDPRARDWMAAQEARGRSREVHDPGDDRIGGPADQTARPEARSSK